ncbi:phytanoyl-CoA dioxygenase family protein [Pseudorhodoferax sp.]|uniref:phytanoyl-CoA dioxygenase family protein n=1 Tax=Pseudorhodoferax sp. TaxID=1993553 RepID=UPI002DD6A079|nr:phytanoyl-CoA dioxygenase family protein [Pseudorhodoferax sp.]
MLTAEQQAAWQQDGYLALPGFKTAAEGAVLQRRAREIVDAFEPGDTRAVFSSTQPERLADAALIASAEAVHCFFEEEAFDASGALRQPKAQSINKIGHALHDLDPVFDAFSRGPALAALAADLGLLRPLLWQSMVIFKQPGIGGEVRWHQDASFFVTEPQSVTTFWFALEDADLDNGCLWVQPGGHRTPLRERFERHGERLQMQRLDDTPWPGAGEARPLPVSAGTLVCFDGRLPHYSAPNRSPKSRMAYTLHVTDGGAAYSALNWLQRERLPLRGF